MPPLARLLAGCALAAGAVVPGTGAHALQTVAFTFVVPCDSSSGTSSGALDMPTGVYAVTVVGACVHNTTQSSSVALGTPCTLPVVGTVPCAGTTVHNVPPAACHTTTGFVRTDCSGAPAGVRTETCGELYVEVAGDCVPGQAGFVVHEAPLSPMTARFSDSVYSDNAGTLVVTAVWTLL